MLQIKAELFTSKNLISEIAVKQYIQMEGLEGLWNKIGQDLMIA